MAFEIGQRVGDYEILDVLEKSKIGVSYRVRNVLAQRFEALKILPVSVQEDNERVERFMREIKVHARLAHPHVVSFYNATLLEGQLVMTTELVEGVTLAHLLEPGALPIPQAAGYVCQVLAALGYAHEQGIVHREITPEHMIVMPDGTVKLGGFGLAKSATDPQLTQAGAVLGSLRYISPEQVKGSTSLDGRADLYSVGVVLYEATTGRLPFDSKSQFDVMLAHVNQAPPAPVEFRPDLPLQLNEIILKALAKDPAERFQTAQDFQSALDALGLMPPGTRPAAAAPERQVEPASGPAWRPEPPSALPPLTAAGAGLAEAASRWRSTELIAAGVFTFIIVTVAVWVLLTLGRN